MSNSMLVNTVAFSLGITTEKLFEVVCQNLDMTGLRHEIVKAYEETGRLPVRVYDYIRSFIPSEEQLCTP